MAIRRASYRTRREQCVGMLRGLPYPVCRLPLNHFACRHTHASSQVFYSLDPLAVVLVEPESLAPPNVRQADSNGDRTAAAVAIAEVAGSGWSRFFAPMAHLCVSSSQQVCSSIKTQWHKTYRKGQLLFCKQLLSVGVSEI